MGCSSGFLSGVSEAHLPSPSKAASGSPAPAPARPTSPGFPRFAARYSVGPRHFADFSDSDRRPAVEFPPRGWFRDWAVKVCRSALMR